MNDLKTYFDNQTIDKAMVAAIKKRVEAFKEANGHPQRILTLIKEVIVEPAVILAFEKLKEEKE